ncbi:hypothetical protein F8388_005890 [Cannabis sativa]|uniref:Ty3 transposon capsid-like protein domain-containing protein n=1 Tax=Cannabis sativa TaxID=3483 RepID=A0A7J6HG31_CANSA|nr:hypothetical protein F8388_005890 [Cannabis sativa]KAF4404506.1 hypothetical protein G4B88_005892 [Cannabis sativa]
MGFSIVPDVGNTSYAYEHRRDCRLRRLELPILDGTDPEGWLLRADMYFTLPRFSNEEMLEATTISFEGKALTRYRWELRCRPIVLWEDLGLLVLNKFRNTSKGSLHEQFCLFRQEGSVEDYCEGFLELLAPLDDVSEVVVLSQFLSGLKKNIKEELRLFEPTTLNKAVDFAAKIENKDNSLFGSHSNRNNFKGRGNNGDRRGTNLYNKH